MLRISGTRRPGCQELSWRKLVQCQLESSWTTGESSASAPRPCSKPWEWCGGGASDKCDTQRDTSGLAWKWCKTTHPWCATNLRFLSTVAHNCDGKTDGHGTTKLTHDKTMLFDGKTKLTHGRAPIIHGKTKYSRQNTPNSRQNQS